MVDYSSMTGCDVAFNTFNFAFVIFFNYQFLLSGVVFMLVIIKLSAAQQVKQQGVQTFLCLLHRLQKTSSLSATSYQIKHSPLKLKVMSAGADCLNSQKSHGKLSIQ